jgi:hypothetical protein
MGARNLVELGLSYRPARLHGLVESIPWSRFPSSIKVYEFVLCALHVFPLCGARLTDELKVSRHGLKVLSSEMDPAEIRLIR